MLGAQFGDEAKGKIADFLARDARYVVRSGGGPNTGHTIHLPEGMVVLHLLACGVLRHGVTGVSGPGMVINPFQVLEEIRDLERRQVAPGRRGHLRPGATSCSPSTRWRMPGKMTCGTEPTPRRPSARPVVAWDLRTRTGTVAGGFEWGTSPDLRG